MKKITVESGFGVLEFSVEDFQSEEFWYSMHLVKLHQLFDLGFVWEDGIDNFYPSTMGELTKKLVYKDYVISYGLHYKDHPAQIVYIIKDNNIMLECMPIKEVQAFFYKYNTKSIKLCACINAWGDTLDLLPYCIENILPFVYKVIVVWSERSNYGEIDTEMRLFADNYKNKNTIFKNIEPDLKKSPAQNETDKRNYGLKMAIDNDCTHFISMDSDEMYDQMDFLKEKERFLNPNLNGLVCGSQVYFKHPWLTIGMDTTRVTFIQKITPNLRFVFNRNYPFAFDGNDIRIDPTRQLNINSGVEWSNIICHHYSYIRSDLEKKIRNSTARSNIEKSTIRQDFTLGKIGYFCKFYGKTLIRASVDFGIPDVYKDIQHSAEPLEASSSQKE